MEHPAPSVHVRVLQPADTERFFALRLLALRDSPTAFLSTAEEEALLTDEARVTRTTPGADRFILGAFVDDQLIGVAGVLREAPARQTHKAMLWGVYVSRDWRGRGFGRAIVAEAVRQAFAMAGIQKINLGVNAANAAAVALYESLGFTTYGLERGFMIVDGQPQDEIFMSRDRS
jgi:RimJ/RimL family protein N-acetyltransferase